MDEERLIVALEARIRDFERNMAKAERTGTQTYRGLQNRSQSATRAMERDMTRSTSRINQALATTTSRIGGMGKAFAAGTAAAALGAITTAIKQTISSLAELDGQARRAGVDVEAFQALKFAAEQNRIGVDALTDGLKELQLRADEFIVTGAGPAAEAFARLGYGAKDLSRRLEEPDELFLDLIGRMEDLDRAAQIRVADEVFGGTGGERFVELLSKGEGGIRKLMDRAHELGAVMDEEAIAKAVELDRKFAEVSARVSSLAKSITVNLAGAIEDVLTIDLDEISESTEEAARRMGESTDATNEHGQSVEDLIGRYRELFRHIENMTGAQVSLQYSSVDAMRALADVLIQIDGEMNAFKNGETDARAFEDQIGSLVGEAQTLVGGLNDVDAAQFGNVVAAITGISEALANATQQAQALRITIPGSGEGGIPKVRPAPRPRKEAPTSSVRPRSAPNDIDFGLPPVETASGGGSGGGGGGRAEISDYEREIERTREAIAELEAEAVQLVAVAKGGKDYGDAMEYARKRAELLYQAQADGKAITPELQAEIDNLALSYSEAGRQAEDAADRLRLIEDHAERGADAMSDMFLGIMDGSMSARDALSGLLAELARVQIQKSFLGLSEGGGVFGFLGGLLSGGRATGGPVRGGSAYMVNERTANSEVFVPSQSGGMLNVPQAQAALRATMTPRQAAQPGGKVELILRAAEGVTIEQVQNTAGAMIRNAVPEITRQSVAATQRSMQKSKAGWR